MTASSQCPMNADKKASFYISVFFLFSEVLFLETDLRAVLYFKSLLFCFGVKATFSFKTLQQHSETQSMKSLSASLIIGLMTKSLFLERKRKVEPCF